MTRTPTTAESDGRIIRTEISRTRHSDTGTAPNGSSSGTYHWTMITYRQTWTHDPRNGEYAGLSYREREWWISPSPTTPGQLSSWDSQPWND